MSIQQTVTYGNFLITQSFFDPTVDIFNEWRTEYLAAIELTDINVMFMGNAAERFYGNSTMRTIDVDIMFSGDITCSRKKEVMEKAFELGINRRLYVDLSLIHI